MIIKAKQRLQGATNVGDVLKGDRGDPGVTFIPSIDEEGNLSWTNDGNLDNPETVNLKGPKGDNGNNGEPGKSAYECAKEAGFVGTEEEFATKLAGGGTASAVPDDEMLVLLIDMDIVQPLSNANNAIFTDENNKLYVL